MEKPIDCLIIISIDHCVQTRYRILLMLQVCREMMALPLLPHEHIVAAFDLLAARVTATTPMLLELVAYMRSTWITGAVFTPRDWCVYRQVVRTNNDVEGWHYRLNHRGKRGKPISKHKQCTFGHTMVYNLILIRIYYIICISGCSIMYNARVMQMIRYSYIIYLFNYVHTLYKI